MKCFQCNGADIGDNAREIAQHARAIHNQSLTEWKQAHEKASLSYPLDEDFAADVDEGAEGAPARRKIK
jgi:hypothetical protein